jgi:hypothetical protein
MTVWKTLNYEELYPRLEQMGYDVWLQFCRWIDMHSELRRINSFTDETQFTREQVNNTLNSPSWSEENPHKKTEGTFQHRYSANLWRDITFNRLIGPLFF